VEHGESQRASGRAWWRRRRLAPALLPIIGIALVLLVLALAEGDLPEELTDLQGLVSNLLARFGPAASLALLYIEESGVPLPVPGDVYVAYLGHAAAGSAPRLAAAWVAIIVVVVAGATNLYLVARRWGYRLLRNRLGRFVRLEPERLERAEEWFARWGALTIIFGRHVPGFRIAITVMAGIFRVPYRVFAPSVAISTAVWAGLWIVLGANFTSALAALAGLFATHRWTVVAGAAAIALGLATVLVRAFKPNGRGTAAPPA
jgi:membrane protein DedA with SNARE-associated domain